MIRGNHLSSWIIEELVNTYFVFNNLDILIGFKLLLVLNTSFTHGKIIAPLLNLEISIIKSSAIFLLVPAASFLLSLWRRRPQRSHHRIVPVFEC